MSAIPDLTLWGVGTSRTIRPHWAMHELALPYKTKPIGPRTGETKTAEYTRLNPRQKVPLLQDGDFCIGESAAIVAYLSRTYSTPDRSLVPETQREFAAWLEWCFFIVAELDSTWDLSMELRQKSWHRPVSIFGNSCDTWRSRLQTAGSSLWVTGSPAPTSCSRPALTGRSLTVSAFVTTLIHILNVSRSGKPIRERSRRMSR